MARLRRFHAQLVAAGLERTYEAAHARLAIECHATVYQRLRLLAAGKLDRLPEISQFAADRSYFAAAAKLCEGLEKVLAAYEKSDDPRKREMFATFRRCGGSYGVR